MDNEFDKPKPSENKLARQPKGLKYVGDGTSLPGVPARDLTPDEVKKFGKTKLIKTGLYKE
ncbi:MAG: hypothetical protein ACWGQW_01170 [bacterium]